MREISVAANIVENIPLTMDANVKYAQVRIVVGGHPWDDGSMKYSTKTSSTTRHTLINVLLCVLLAPTPDKVVSANEPSQGIPLESMEPEQVVALAQAGDAGAMMTIAHELLQAGDGRAYDWVERAAAASPLGSAYAGQFWLHGVYQSGGRMLVEPNVGLAVQLLTRAADENVVLAITELGAHYNLHGLREQPQPHVAYQLYQRVAALGDSYAQSVIQTMDTGTLRMGRLSLITPVNFSRVPSEPGKILFVSEQFGERSEIQAWSEQQTGGSQLSARKARKLFKAELKRWAKVYRKEFSRSGNRVHAPTAEIQVSELQRGLLTVHGARHDVLVHLIQLDQRDGMLHHLVSRTDDTLYGAGHWMDYLIASMKINPL